MAIINLTPTIIKTHQHGNSKDYSGFPVQLDTQGTGPDDTPTPAGGVLVGYSHFYNDGGDFPPFSPTTLRDTVFRGLVQFTLPVIHGELTRATLSFMLTNSQYVQGGAATNAPMSCLTKLLLATENWFGGIDHPPPGDLFQSLPFVSPQDTPWLFIEPGGSVVAEVGDSSSGFIDRRLVNGRFKIDVTEAVERWLTGQRPNFGFVFTTDDERDDAEDNDTSISGYFDFRLEVRSVIPAPAPLELRLAACAETQERLHVVASTKDGALLYSHDQHDLAHPANWLALAALEGKTLRTPTLIASMENQVDLLVTAAPDRVFHNHWDGTAWSAQWEDWGGECGVPPSVIRWSENQLDLFVSTPSPRRHVLHRSFSNGQWYSDPWSASWSDTPSDFKGWDHLHNINHVYKLLTYPPSGARTTSNTMELIAVDNESLRVQITIWDKLDPFENVASSENWTYLIADSWEDLGASVPTDQVTMVFRGANQVDLFGTQPEGADTNTVWHKAWTRPYPNPIWTPGLAKLEPPNFASWMPGVDTTHTVGGGVRKEIQATAGVKNHVDVFAVKADASHHLVHTRGSGKNWSAAWENLGIAVHPRSAPCVIANGSHTEIFVIDLKGTLWHGHGTDTWTAATIHWNEIGQLPV